MSEELGRLAYEAYGDTVGWITFSGTKMPGWAEQNERLRLAWIAAAEAVERKVSAK
jgi:hypothetical protein